MRITKRDLINDLLIDISSLHFVIFSGDSTKICSNIVIVSVYEMIKVAGDRLSCAKPDFSVKNSRQLKYFFLQIFFINEWVKYVCTKI